MVTDTRIQKSLTQQHCNGCNGCTDSIYPPHTRDGTKHSTRTCALSPYKCWKPSLLALRLYIVDFVHCSQFDPLQISEHPPHCPHIINCNDECNGCTDVTDRFT